jgi:hypothetical protein
MRTPDPAYVSSALAATEGPCVSIYLPAGRPYPENRQAPIRFKDLARRAEETLAKSHPGPAAKRIADQLHQLEGNHDFWSHAGEGVAVLASPNRFDAFSLPRAVAERVEVADTFHVKPLLRHAQSVQPFHVLCISRDRVALFRGNRHELEVLEVPGVPLTFSEELGTTSGGQPSSPASAVPESTSRPGVRVGGNKSHGALVRDDMAVRQERPPEVGRFFRTVDAEVVHRVSEPSGLPVVLFGTDDNLAEFRRLSKNRFLTADGVRGDWVNWSLQEIREKAWGVFEKHYQADLARIREDFGTATARGMATDDLKVAARAVAEGRVGTLLIDADRTHPGAIDLTSGELRPQPGGDTAAGDMLDDLAEMALQRKARVVVTSSADMPTNTGLAAIYRF